MTALALPVVLQLIGACAPTVAPSTMASILQTESGFDPWMLHVNGPGGGDLRPATKDDAIEQAVDLVVVQRKSVDLGLGQVNSANLASLGLTISDALDPCKNLAASAKILAAGYLASSRSQADPQRALRAALSQYNTGDPARGIANGYVGKVEKSAEYVVPAISSLSARSEIPPASAGEIGPVRSEAQPPSWDVFALAATHSPSVFASSAAQAPSSVQVAVTSGAPPAPVATPAASSLFTSLPPAAPNAANQPASGPAAAGSAPVVLHADK